MERQQAINLNADILGGFSAIFMNLVLLIVGVYTLIMILNFLRDKFISQEASPKKETITDLLTILNKLFFISGFGFIIGNVVQMVFHQISGRSGMPAMSFRGEWDYLTFGIILIFIGLGFKAGKKVLVMDREQ